MNQYAGAVCAKCHQGHLSSLRLSAEWEVRLTNKYGSMLCADCKRKIMTGHILRGAALPWDLPGFGWTFANYHV